MVAISSCRYSLGAVLAAAAVALSLPVGAVPVALADPPYANCKEAHADGKYNIPRGAPGYSAKLDRDGDGLACEG
ncbi:excalibur calcium-binding domain-containing protein [Mycobacteroides abscessus]|uniref:excalibur calcium-binding domain-containing protein n=1 Tax=Mycobacteroides abscessus TaxID=36809 RepID=UPI0009A59447|nr:excalibur calcium-binding domain-containing protein [Mycobacteroides abscessus]SKG69810.1 excalibur domain-containing protein [Mycobacteroides abscessus subsp. massiliense]SKH82547.1 excalibur domain-containing protein [Mycobacteroides abscessus subsp. massiliense]SKI05269.1 excalibur domain-containing protein [Mycobacteroides abscessus subsp. massiliense]SKI51061.1 excalibur domain-containing protein [Mycobacteroides abscessus subsp. massiliense]SKJ72434.1 excalibur domain-containing prote